MGLLLVALPVVLLIWMVLYPAALAIWTTVLTKDADGQTQLLAPYFRFFSDAYSLKNLWLTVWVTLVTALLRVAIAMPLALYLRFRTGPLAAAVQSLALFPMFVPSILVAYAFIRVLGPNGTVDTILVALHLPKMVSPYLKPIGPVIGMTWDGLPLTVLLLIAGLGRVSRASVEAARDVGAGALTIFLEIILPRLKSSLIVTFSFNILGLFSAFTLPYLLGPASPEMMGPYMQRTFSDNADAAGANAQAVVTFLLCAAFGIIYVRAIAAGRRGAR
jgi:ABC-type spermidine/putrescine transport system permease subunit I